MIGFTALQRNAQPVTKKYELTYNQTILNGQVIASRLVNNETMNRRNLIGYTPNRNIHPGNNMNPDINPPPQNPS